MQALILAGGKGTRLRPLTVYTPKPVVPICNRPFLLYQLEMLREANVQDITLSLSYQPQKIEQLLGEGEGLGVNLNYTVEPQPMGTAGAYKFAQDRIRETTIVFNGDVLTDLNLEAVIKEHKERKAGATIVLTPVENPSAYGLVETERDGRVKRFLEKPKPEELDALGGLNTINAGTYILEPHLLDLIPAGENYSFEYGLFPQLLERGEAFFAHIPEKTYWLDIGTPARYMQAHQDLLAGFIPRFAPEKRRGQIELGDGASVDDSSIIADGCTIKPGAQIINSTLGENCYVEEKARIENSVIWAHTRISAGAHVANSIIGRGCHIGRNASVTNGATLGDKTSLTDFTITGGALQ